MNPPTALLEVSGLAERTGGWVAQEAQGAFSRCRSGCAKRIAGEKDEKVRQEFERDYPANPERAVSKLLREVAAWQSAAAFAVRACE